MHKKYIKRGGKRFGPYYYETYREGDKIKTKYVGTKPPSKLIDKLSVPKISLNKSNVFQVSFVVALLVLTTIAVFPIDQNVSGVEESSFFERFSEFRKSITGLVAESFMPQIVMDEPVEETSTGSSQSSTDEQQINSQETVEETFVGIQEDVLQIQSESIPGILWNRTNGTSNQDTLNDVDIDSGGNIYAIGTIEVGGTYNSVFLSKFDSDGNILWEKNFTVFSGKSSYGEDIVVDSAGNFTIAVTARNDTASTNVVYIAKFNSSGDNQWNQTYNNSGSAELLGIDVNANDYSHAVGYYSNSSGDSNGVVYVHDTEGTLQFNTSIPMVVLEAVAISNSDHVYMTGDQYWGVSDDIYVAEYDDTGVKVWNASFGDVNLGEQGKAITLDSGGNVVIVGESEDSAALDAWMMIVKYDSSGNFQWNLTTGTDYGSLDSVLTDSGDNIYVSGDNNTLDLGENPVGNHIWFAKYDPGGNILWNRTVGSSGDFGMGIAANSEGQIVQVGQTSTFQEEGGTDYMIVKYNTSDADICETLFEPEELVLLNNVESTGTCFHINSSDVTLDCADYNITFGTGGAGDGINVSGVSGEPITNITIKNCNIFKDPSGGGSTNNGISFREVNYSLVYNNTIITNGSDNNRGIYTTYNSSNITIHENQIESWGGSSLSGIFLSRGQNNTISYNQISVMGEGSTSSGITISIAEDSLFDSNIIYVNGTANIRGIYLGSEEITILNNTFYINGTSINNEGIEVNEGFNNITGNRIFIQGNGVSGYNLRYQGNNNTISRNTVGLYGNNSLSRILSIETRNNNTFDSEIWRVYGNGTYIEDLYSGSSDNTLTNITFERPGEGSVRFLGTQTITTKANVSKENLNISNNRTYLNSSDGNVSFLNVSAEVIIHGLTLSAPIEILMDEGNDGNYVDCGNKCNLTSYNGSTAVFNVSSFTSYAVQEGVIGTEGVNLTNCTTITNSHQNYFLNQTVNTAGHCFRIDAENVTIDCQGHLINQTNFTFTEGQTKMAFNISRPTITETNITIKNCIINNPKYGIWVRNVTHNVFENNTIISDQSLSATGIIMYYGGNNTVRENNVTGMSSSGIRIYGSSDNLISYNNVTHSDFGIYIEGANNQIVNNSAIDNYEYDFNIFGWDSEEHCNNLFEGNNASNNLPFLYYNSTAVDLSNIQLSGLVLCNASYSKITNVTINGSAIRNNSALILSRSRYVNLTNITSNHNNLGARLIRYSENTTIKGGEFSYSGSIGISISRSKNARIIDSNISYNGESGIVLGSSENDTQIINNTIEHQGLCITLQKTDNATITGNMIANCSSSGVYSYDSGKTNPNLIYNNLFNSTTNLAGNNWPNDWNVTQRVGPRVLSAGTDIGGNFWASPSGSGFSETCVDDDGDGFCDSEYEIGADNNTDYLALSDDFGFFDNNITAPRNLTVEDRTYLVNTSFVCEDTCIIVKAHRVTVDCQGYQLNFSQINGSAAINVSNYDNVTIKNCNLLAANDTMYQNTYAVYMQNTSGNLVNHTNVSHSTSINFQTGIKMISANNSVVRNANLSMEHSSYYGLDLSSSSNNSFVDILVEGMNNRFEQSSNENELAYSNIGSINILSGSAFNRIHNNTLTGGSDYALRNFQAGNQLIEDNEISIGGTADPAVDLYGSQNNIIQRNVINSTGSSGAGIYMRYSGVDANNNTIIDNNITAAGNALYFSSSATNNTLVNNVLETTGDYSETVFFQAYTNNNSLFSNTLKTTGNTNPRYIRSEGDTGDNNLTNTTFVGYNGSVRVVEEVVFPNNTILGTNTLNITYNKAFLNSTNASYLDKYSQITFHSLSWVTPEVLIDQDDDGTGVSCPTPSCYWQEYNGTTFIFNVTGFTTYTSREYIEPMPCATLDTEHQTYTLGESVNTSGTCFVIEANNVTLDCDNNTINYSQTAQGNAIKIMGANHTTIKDCDIVEGGSNTGSYAIIVNKSENVTLFNNRIKTDNQNSHGMFLQFSKDLNLTYNAINTSGTSADGMEISNVNWSIFFNNNIDSTGQAMLLATSHFNNISNNRGETEDFGIQLSSSEGNLILNNSFSSNSNAMFIQGANNILENNTLSNQPDSESIRAIGENITINNNNITRGKWGVRVLGSSNYNVSIINNVINSTDTGGSSFLIEGGNVLIFNNSLSGNKKKIIVNGSDNLVNVTLRDQYIENYTVENASINFEVTDIGGLYLLNLSIYQEGVNLTEDVQITSNKTYINSSNAPGFNVSANITLHGLEGFNEPVIKVALDDSTFVDCDDGTVPACYNLSWNGSTLTFNVSSFSTYIVQEADVINRNVTACGTLSDANTVYTVNTSLSSSADCLTIANDNITVDCQGNTITYGNSETGQGIEAITRENITIKNCILEKGDGGNSDNYGIYFFTVSGGVIYNNTISTNGTISNTGIRLGSTTELNTSLNTIQTTGTGQWNYGIHCQGCGESIFESNVIFTNGTGGNQGLNIDSFSDNNIFKENNITVSGTSGGNHGIRVSFSDDNNFSDNKIFVDGELGGSGDGVHIIGSSNLNMTNTRIYLDVGASDAYIYSRESLEMSNTTFYNDFGEVRFPQTLEINNRTNATDYRLNISNNRTYMNSSDGNVSSFNVSAEITMHNLIWSNPEILLDYSDTGTYAVCSAPQCNETSYNGTTIVFNVSHFTTYSTREASSVNAPTNFNISLNYSDLAANITLNWSDVSGADGYYIWFDSNASWILELNNTDAPTANVTLVGESNSDWIDTNSSNYTQRYYAVAAYLGSGKNITGDKMGMYVLTISGEGKYGHDMISLPLEQNMSLEETIFPGNNLASFTTINRSTDVASGDSPTFVTSFYHSSLGGWVLYPELESLEFGKGYYTDSFDEDMNITNIGRIPTGNVSRNISNETEWGHDLIGFESFTEEDIDVLIPEPNNLASFTTVNRSVDVDSGDTAGFVTSFYHSSLGGWNFYPTLDVLEDGFGYFTDSFLIDVSLNYTRNDYEN